LEVLAVVNTVRMESENFDFRPTELIQLSAYKHDWKVLAANK